MLHVVLKVWGMLLGCGFWFVQQPPHSQFSEGARHHLCMDEWNQPTPFCRLLSLTQAVWGKLTPTVLALVMGMRAQSLDVLSHYSMFHL